MVYTADLPKLKINLWHFEILTWELMRKPKLCNTSKQANRREQKTKMWDSGRIVHIW